MQSTSIYSPLDLLRAIRNLIMSLYRLWCEFAHAVVKK